ncbi:putative choline transporter, neither null mutation nor overexpression affects choline transport [Ciborinia camelliae]|nr:putative choline transporter, neither null mutation nor overexpression affects choline transport [Ciborinia camelliae]
MRERRKRREEKFSSSSIGPIGDRAQIFTLFSTFAPSLSAFSFKTGKNPRKFRGSVRVYEQQQQQQRQQQQQQQQLLLPDAMAPRRRVTPSGTTSAGGSRAPSGNSSFLPSGTVSGSAPSGNNSSSAASAAYVSGSSTITTDKVPEGGVLWALIILLCGLAVSFAFGLYMVIRAGQMEAELSSYLFQHLQDLDCGVGPLTIGEARKVSGLLREKIPFVAPSFGTSVLLAYFFLGLAFLLRRANFTQWISGGAAVLGIVGALLLNWYVQFTASVVSIVFAALCLIWLILWHNSRHLSKAICSTVCKLVLNQPVVLALSVSASAITILIYGGYLVVLYSLRQQWDTRSPSCTKDRSTNPPKLLTETILLSLITYWTTQTISTLAQTLASTVTQQHISNVQSGLRQSKSRKSSISRSLRINCGSVCLGAGLLSLDLFLKDLTMGLMQNISLAPADPFHAKTAALLLSLMFYMAPLYAALGEKINDWAFVLVGLDNTSYWHANRIGVTLMSSSGLDLLAKSTGLYQLIEHIPVVIGGIAAMSTYLIITFVPGPIIQTSDVMMADVLVAFAFFGGTQISRAVLAPFKGAMCTIWVLMAREPTLFKDHHGEIWKGLVELNPILAEELLNKEN